MTVRYNGLNLSPITALVIFEIFLREFQVRLVNGQTKWIDRNDFEYEILCNPPAGIFLRQDRNKTYVCADGWETIIAFFKQFGVKEEQIPGQPPCQNCTYYRCSGGCPQNGIKSAHI